MGLGLVCVQLRFGRGDEMHHVAWLVAKGVCNNVHILFFPICFSLSFLLLQVFFRRMPRPFEGRAPSQKRTATGQSVRRHRWCICSTSSAARNTNTLSASRCATIDLRSKITPKFLCWQPLILDDDDSSLASPRRLLPPLKP